jgi:hypothetical protein
MKWLIRWFTGEGELRLLPFLAIALLGRIPAVFFSRGYEFLDHQFQYVDPAFHLATGLPFLRTWDWIDGIRSWVYPGLLSWVMRGVMWLGIETPGPQMVAIRAVHALVSLVPLIGLHDLLAGRERLRGARPLLLFLALNGLAVYQGVQPNGPAVACGLTVFAVCWFLCGGPVRSTIAGLALGLAFCFRPQDGLFGIPLLVAGLVQRRWRDTVLFTSASLALVVVQGIVDQRTWGTFLHSTIAYVRFNLVQGGAANWGREPWWTYPVLLALLAIPVVPRMALRWISAGARRLPAVAGCALFSLLVHQMVAHKAPRFVLPALWLFLVVWGTGALLTRDPASAARRIALRVASGAHVAGFLVASFAYPFKANIEAAQFVGSRPDNTGVVYHGLQDVETGGAFYYRSRAPLLPTGLIGVGKPIPLAERLASVPPPSYLVSRATQPPSLPGSWRAVEVARFAPMLPFKPHRVLVVYRISNAE